MVRRRRDDGESHSRAREDFDVAVEFGLAGDHSFFPDGRELRVQYCMRLMAERVWVKGDTGELIAGASGLSVDTLKDIAAEASRRIRSACDPEQVRSLVMPALAKTIQKASESDDPKAWQAVASLSKVYLDGSGAAAPQKHEHTGKDGTPLIPGTNRTLTDLSLEELKALAERAEVPKPN